METEILNHYSKINFNFLSGKVKKNFPLASMTWFKVGGPADLFFQPRDLKDLQKFLKSFHSKIPLFVIGAGSNSLVRDGGIEGVVLNLGKNFSKISIEEDCFIKVGAGQNCIKLARKLAELGIGGLEFFSGIPGSVGGAIKMNAGAYNSQTSDRLVSISSLDREGNKKKLNVNDFVMEYRNTNFPKDHIFYEALFDCDLGNKYDLLDQISKLNERRKETQPIKDSTGGSTFKNPNKYKAWKLIRESGCANLRVGGAHVSKVHSNFIVNDGTATSNDIEELGEKIRKKVRKTFGINLEWEINIVGNKKIQKELL